MKFQTAQREEKRCSLLVDQVVLGHFDSAEAVFLRSALSVPETRNT